MAARQLELQRAVGRAVADPVGRRIVVLVDSLSDECAFGFQVTTNPGLPWVDHVAQYLKCHVEPP